MELTADERNEGERARERKEKMKGKVGREGRGMKRRKVEESG